MRDFLLEIGTEEIPARFIPGALAELGEKAAALLREARLGHGDVRTYGTPRRLVLFVTRVAERQEACVKEVKGPPRRSAFDESGRPTKAATGFAKSQGVDVDALVVRQVGKTEYVFAVKEEPGRPATEILGELCPRLITAISFPRPMRWGESEVRFVRPIRWLVALYGDEVVEFALDGLRSGRESAGHRFLAPGKVSVKNPAEYFSKMAARCVTVDPAERRRMIREQIDALAAAEGGCVPPDEELLEEVVNLVEYPTAFCGDFPEKYLDLPRPVLITVMREHQRCFPVCREDGQLLPRFLGVHNSAYEHTATIRRGNEQVVRARLADAAFFYREDAARRLADRVEGLKKVVYQEALGTVYEKTKRLGALTLYLGKTLNISRNDKAAASRAAYLSKADLLTNMVYEFPELQGVMGKEYAIKDGEPEAVAEALYEQYLPRFAGDALPQTAPGRLLSIADKIDNLVGCFGTGLIPTGSQDPYALRRQAFGVCAIILAGRLHLSLNELVLRAYREYRGRLGRDERTVLAELVEFFKQRLRGIFEERGISGEVTEAVLAAEIEDIRAAWLRAEALQAFRGEALFADLYTPYTRAANLSRTAPDREPDPGRFVDPAERRLYETVLALREKVAPDLAMHAYRNVLAELTALREPVDTFFDAVLVMDEDRTLRENRLALLRSVVRLVHLVADLSKIPVG
ncbi:MAG TPA: glycine--tRNA ligase subunit beta [Desulfotomaculum sp.]|nr:glycine--tRNA ligase subunit beta [Desulfotomaculum sp.]